MAALRTRVTGMRWDLAEASGAMGDLGTFVPLTVSLIVVCGMDAGSVLLFAGIYNVVTGVQFNLPVPVQPMKAIAAVAVAEGLSPGTIGAAGLGVGAALLLLTVTGLIETLDRVVPRPIVRGIQLGVGLKLAIKGLQMVPVGPALALDGWLVAALGAAFVLVMSGRRRFPTALILFAAGLVLMALSGIDSSGLVPGWEGLRLVLPSADEWRVGLTRGSLPQLPLTLLNSVIAVCALSGDLYPGRKIGVRQMGISVAAINLVGCWFGAMPACHGAGGLAGQHRFGARTGGSVVMLGAAKIALAVALGSAAAAVLAAYPASILGVLLLFAGVELALPVSTCRGRNEYLVAILTAAGIVGVNTLMGLAIGAVAAAALSRRAEA